MAKQKKAKKGQPVDQSSEYMKGGKGRKDDVRGSRIYPVGAPDAPANAEVVAAGELGEGPRSRLPVKGSTAALAKKPR